MNRPDEPNPLTGLRVPAAPEALADRVLCAANQARQPFAVPSIWDRLWNSRPLRLAWAVALLVLLAIHTGLSLFPDSSLSSTASPRADSRELRALLALPRVEISPRAEALAMGGGSKPSDGDRKGDKPS